MNTKFDLELVVKLITDNVPLSRSRKDYKLGEEYLIINVTEEDLLKPEIGFEYIGKDFSQTRPMYKKENIECFFEEQILHLYTVY